MVIVKSGTLMNKGGKTLADRVARASERSSVLQERASVLVTVSAELRRSELVTQCAWCGRLSDGNGRWSEAPQLVLRPELVTGSICPDCFAANSPR